jgi:hypothetical protein
MSTKVTGPRSSGAMARKAVERAKGAGIWIILITADHPHTASAIAHELKIALDDRVLSGAEPDEMSDTDLNEVDPTRLSTLAGILNINYVWCALCGITVRSSP